MTRRRLRLTFLIYLVSTVIAGVVAFMVGSAQRGGAQAAPSDLAPPAAAIAAPAETQSPCAAPGAAPGPATSDACAPLPEVIPRICSPLRQALLHSIADKATPRVAALEALSPPEPGRSAAGMLSERPQIPPLAAIRPATIASGTPPFVLVDGAPIPAPPPPVAAEVPLPAAAPLLLFGVAALAAAGNRRRRAST